MANANEDTKRSVTDDDLIDTDSLICETRRLCQRYIDEIVLPYSLCPWAAPALRNSSVQMHVITQQFSANSDLVPAARAVQSALFQVTDEAIELVLVMLPRCTFSRLEMDDLLRHVRQDGVRRDEREGEIAFALAAFHPDAEPDTTTAERFIPYLRRSPDPMIQAVRTSVLSKIDPARGSGTAYFDLKTMSLEALATPTAEPLRSKIARANLETCTHAGLAQLEETYAAILEDRRQVWARLRSENPVKGS